MGSVTMTAAEADQYAGGGAPHVVSIDGVSFLVGVGMAGLAKAEPKRLISFLKM